MPEPRTCPGCGAALPVDAPAGLCPACLLRHGVAGASEAATAPPTAPPPYQGAFIPPPVSELARQFPQLEVIELLGQGGMGAVYKARQPHLDRLVAQKILPPDAAGDPAFAERFAREARALARLNHPGIVAIYDFGRAGDLYYLLMEYVDGVNLRRLIQDKKLQPAEALRIVPQLCDALQYAHDEGVVHRDIKPENVLVDRKGRVKVADFGLAKLLHPGADQSRLTGTGQVMGTWRYMAPEQLDNPLAVDHRADIYSLGVVFYELLTGELPVGRFPLPSQKAHVDVRLDEVVLKALEKEPERRYQHASEVKTEIESVAGGGPPHPAAPGVEERLAAFLRDAAAGDRQAIERIRNTFDVLRPIAASVLGAAGTVLLFAWIFHVIPGNVGLFLWITCYALGGVIGAAGSHGRKVDAARAIRSPEARDASLAQVALEAADEGEGAAAVEALAAIKSQVLRDQTAAAAARKLADADQQAFAFQAANLITNPARRDEILKRLAHVR